MAEADGNQALERMNSTMKITLPEKYHLMSLSDAQRCEASMAKEEDLNQKGCSFGRSWLAIGIKFLVVGMWTSRSNYVLVKKWEIQSTDTMVMRHVILRREELKFQTLL